METSTDTPCCHGGQREPSQTLVTMMGLRDWPGVQFSGEVPIVGPAAAGLVAYW